MIIFDIKRYAINDGPGIRTTIFFKGCPLRCVWCHNPESWSTEPQILFNKNKCIHCPKCVGKNADECPTTAREICGREWSLSDLLKEIEKERDIMEDSGGGVTLCGGEPLMHFEDSLALLKELGKHGLHRCVDTTLYAKPEMIKEIAANCELFLVDLKLMDDEKHKQYTGVSNRIILENIRMLAELSADFFIRIPLIEGVNTDETNIHDSIEFLKTLPWERKIVNLLPYHDVGKDKHTRMGSKYNPKGYEMKAPSDETLDRCKQAFTQAGFTAIIGG